MISIKAAENFQTGCIASLTDGEDGPSREMMCAIMDDILGKGPDHVLYYGGHVNGLGFLRTPFVYDVQNGTWEEIVKSTPIDNLLVNASPIKYKLVATGNMIGFATNITIAILDAKRMCTTLRRCSNGISPTLTGNETMVIMPNNDLYLFYVNTHVREQECLLVAKGGEQEWSHLHVIPNGIRLCQQYGIPLDDRMILLVGGYDLSNINTQNVIYMMNIGDTGYTKRCMLYDTIEHRFREGGSTIKARNGCRGCVLPTGHVFLSGGVYDANDMAHLGDWNRDQPLDDQAEIYDPLSKKWSLVKGRLRRRAGHTCTLIAPNLVLIAGGWVGYGKRAAASQVCEIYNLDDDSVTETAPLPKAVHYGVAAPLFGRLDEKSTQHVGN
jgi:hypothetical protein